MTTFSCGVKNTVCAVKSSADEKVAELFGMLYSCDRFDERGILFVTENEHAMDRFCLLLRKICCVDGTSCVRKGGRGKRFIFEGGENVFSIVSEKIPLPENADLTVFSDKRLGAAFVRGLFVASGSVSDPEKALYAEIGIKNEQVIETTLDIFSALGIVVRVSHRQSGNFFYFKTADDIYQLLYEIGAKNQAFEYINSDIVRTIRNDANRAGNCDVANAKKQAASALKQIEAAKKLKKAKYVNTADIIVSIAEARLAHPDMNIEQLGNTFDPPLSKSGTAYRLKMLIAASEKLK